MVLRACRAVLGPDEAEDAWSETFLAALKAYPKLGRDANVEAWLVTIAHRKASTPRGARPLAVESLPERHPVTGGGIARLWPAGPGLNRPPGELVDQRVEAGLLVAGPEPVAACQGG